MRIVRLTASFLGIKERTRNFTKVYKKVGPRGARAKFRESWGRGARKSASSAEGRRLAAPITPLSARWPGWLHWHLERVRQAGRPRWVGFALFRWAGEQQLLELMAAARELGCLVFNAHALTVEDGGLGVVDADQVAAKRAYDPDGLMNPGKLRGWLEQPQA